MSEKELREEIKRLEERVRQAYFEGWHDGFAKALETEEEEA